MIKQNDSIQYRNVVSQKVIIHPHQMEEAIELVKSTLVEHGATLTGRFFYTLEDILEEEDLQVELFFEIVENDVPIPDSMSFQSYYYMHSMLSLYVYRDFTEEMMLTYMALMGYAEQHQLKMTTPFFHEVGEYDDLKYVHVKVGTRVLTEAEIWM